MSAKQLNDLVQRTAIFPIVTPTSEKECLDVIAALVDVGATGIKIVLRSHDAMAVLKTAATAFPTSIFAAGTVLTEAQLDEAMLVGAKLAISPGLCPRLSSYAIKNSLPYVPGEHAGGVDALRDLSSIFPDLRFMPSGKIKEHLVTRYAALTKVLSIGGS